MRRRLLRLSPGLAITLAASVVVGAASERFARAEPAKSASANDVARARALDREGVRAYKEERYNDAIRYFTEAFKLGGPPSELWNIAKCHERLDQPEEATRALETYLAQPGLSAADRAEASQQLQEIKRRHSTLTVASSPPGATVYLDGRRGAPAGATPLSLDVAPGSHAVAIEHPGYEPYTKQVDAAYGRAVIVDAQLARNDEPLPPRERARNEPAAPPAVPHRLALGAAIGATVPRFGGVGGSAGVAGILDASYALRDAQRVILAVGGRVMVNGEGWGNGVGATDAPDGGCVVATKESATAVSAFVTGVFGYRASSRVRLGADVGLGLAAYALDRAGGDVFIPTCRAAPGVKPAVQIGTSVSYALTREVRLAVLPLVIEAQPAFEGARSTPRDASGLWLRFGAGLGLAFDLF